MKSFFNKCHLFFMTTIKSFLFNKIAHWFSDQVIGSIISIKNNFITSPWKCCYSFFSLMIRLSLIIGVVLLIVSPVYFLIIVALFSNNQAISVNQSIVPDGFNINNFLVAIQENQNQFLRAFGWTILFAFLASLLKAFVLITGGFGLSLMQSKTRLIICIILMFLMSIPEVVLYTGLYRNTIAWNLKESVIFLPISVPLVFSYFSLIYFRNAFLSINLKFNKMTIIDRLTIIEKIRYMYFPKLKFALIISLIFSMISAWNSFLWPNIILSGTEIVVLGQWFRSLGFIPQGQLQNLMAVGATITMIIPLIFYWISAKWVNRSFFKPIKQ
ncbi:Sugar ABC transporter permease protein [[Mycoplasma] cavipharyngis]|uniref:hypothetical protein n=1 Tax=[Mycoplasma] cavipharyngis TaxID=92757 RepID=UPI0037049AD8